MTTHRSEVVPEYVEGVFELKDFTQSRRGSSNYFLSNPIVVNDLVWRLKVYPDGNGSSKGFFLAVFLFMEQGLQTAAKYEYRVELVNHRSPQLAVVRESVSEFVAGDCWGYPKFAHIEDLYSEGYLNEDRETLVIKFYIRAPLYSQQAREQERYIARLEGQLKAMKEDVEKYKKICIEHGLRLDIGGDTKKPAEKTVGEDTKEEKPEAKAEEDNKVELKQEQRNVLDEVISSVKIDPNSCCNSEANDSEREDANHPEDLNEEETKGKEEAKVTEAKNNKIKILESNRIESQDINKEEALNSENQKSDDEEINDYEDSAHCDRNEVEESKSNLNESSEQEDSLVPTPEEIDILKEISNRYSADIKLGHKLLLNMKKKTIEDIKFSPSEKDSPYNKQLEEELNNSSSVSNDLNLEDDIIDDE